MVKKKSPRIRIGSLCQVIDTYDSRYPTDIKPGDLCYIHHRWQHQYVVTKCPRDQITKTTRHYTVASKNLKLVTSLPEVICMINI